jgi:hypothetical protein
MTQVTVTVAWAEVEAQAAEAAPDHAALQARRAERSAYGE